jgi:hypothetical protein
MTTLPLLSGGRTEVRRAAHSFPFLSCSRPWALSPSSASQEGTVHHGPPRGLHPPDLLLFQCPDCHHSPGHLPCGEYKGGWWKGCVCTCVCRDLCLTEPPASLWDLVQTLSCSGPQFSPCQMGQTSSLKVTHVQKKCKWRSCGAWIGEAQL